MSDSPGPFEAPRPPPEVAPGDAAPPFACRAAGGALFLEGLFVAVAAAQLFAFFHLEPWARGVVSLLLVGGLLAVGLAPWVGLARAGPAVVAAGLAPCLALLQGGWSLSTLFSGLLSPLQLLAALACLPAAVLSPATVGQALAASRARRALYED